MKKPCIEAMLKYLGIEITPKLKKILAALRRKEVDENEIAETLKVRVNDIRKSMYKLSHKSYVTYTKEKSESKQWWYVYTWKLNKSKIIEDYITKKTQELASKQEQLAKELRSTFRCSGCAARSSYDEALEGGFICPLCNGYLEQIKRRNTAAQLERDIAQLEQDIETVVGRKKR